MFTTKVCASVTVQHNQPLAQTEMFCSQPDTGVS